MSDNDKRGFGCLYLLAVLLPPLGFLAGLYLYLQRDDERWKAGFDLMALSAVALVFFTVTGALAGQAMVDWLARGVPR